MNQQMARLLDHRGEWTEPFPVGTVTCRAGDALWDHRLFCAEQVYPGDNLFQAITLCGRRALEIPGKTSEADCPTCLEYMAEDSPERYDDAGSD